MLNPEKNKEIQVKKFHGIENYDEDDSIQNRVEEMDQCLGLFKSSPFFGKGFGFQYHFWRIYVKAEGGPGWLDTNFTHSDLMFLLSKGGILGTSIFCIMLYGLLKNSWRLRLDATDKQQFLWATFSILMIINSVIIGLSTPIYQARFHMFTFAVILAYVYSFDAPFGYAEYRISSADGDNK
jgi:O-antigen ligase